MRYLALFLLVSLSACKSKPKPSISIATAANVQFAMEELTKKFEKETGISAEIILGSSGKLTAQIKEGAPYDIFVSANVKYPEELYASKLTTNPPEVYAYGLLVMWTTVDSIQATFEELIEPKIKHIALANPKTAPYGEAAVQSLTNLGLYKSVENKLVYGESISQANQFILSQAAEIGFTSKSVVVSEQLKNKGTWSVVDSQLYKPIAQGVVVLKNENTESSEKFYKYLFSREAREILVKYGYNVDPER